MTLVGGVSLLVLLGVAFGFYVDHLAAPIAVLGVLGFVALLYGLTKWLDPRWEELEKERLAFLRGWRGEQLVGWRLECLSDSWHVFHGIQIDDDQDLDHVLVGPGGLFYIQTKNLRGLVSEGPDGRAQHNGRPTSLPGQTLAQAMKLKDRLSALLGDNDVWMNAVLAVPFAYVEGRGEIGRVFIVHQDNILERLEAQPKRMKRSDVERYARAIEMLAASARNLHRRSRSDELRLPGIISSVRRALVPRSRSRL